MNWRLTGAALGWCLLAGCSHTETNTEYYCSYETTEADYQRCMEVGRELERSRQHGGGEE